MSFAAASMLCVQLFTGELKIDLPLSYSSRAEVDTHARQLILKVWHSHLPVVLEGIAKRSADFSQEVAGFTAQDLALLKKVSESLSQEQLSFEEQLKVPDYPTARGAVTGDYVGSPVVFDLKQFRLRRGTFSEAQILSLMIHELGHHHGIVDDALLNVLGHKVSEFLLQEREVFELKNLVVEHLSGSKGFSVALLSDGQNIMDLKSGLSEALWERRVDEVGEALAIRQHMHQNPQSYPHSYAGFFNQIVVVDQSRVHFPKKSQIQKMREAHLREFPPRVEVLNFLRVSEADRNGRVTLDFDMSVVQEFEGQRHASSQAERNTHASLRTSFLVSVSAKRDDQGHYQIENRAPLYRKVSQLEVKQTRILGQSEPGFKMTHLNPGDTWKLKLIFPISQLIQAGIALEDFSVTSASIRSSRLNWAQGLDIQYLNMQVGDLKREQDAISLDLTYPIDPAVESGEFRLDHLETNIGRIVPETPMSARCGSAKNGSQEFTSMGVKVGNQRFKRSVRMIELPYGELPTRVALALPQELKTKAETDPWVNVDLSYSLFINSAASPAEANSMWKSRGRPVEETRVNSYEFGRRYYIGKGLSQGLIQFEQSKRGLEIVFSDFWRDETHLPMHPNTHFPALKLFALRVITRSGKSISYSFGTSGIEVWKVEDPAERFSRYWGMFFKWPEDGATKEESQY